MPISILWRSLAEKCLGRLSCTAKGWEKMGEESGKSCSAK
jgi:hypothetical protein